MSKLNENLKAFRIFRRLTQSELATAICKSKNVVSNWERGDNSPDVDSVEMLCKVLKVTPNQLFGWEPLAEYERFKELTARQEHVIRDLQDRRRELLDRLDVINDQMRRAQHEHEIMQLSLREDSEEEQLAPVAAHEQEGATPEDLAEDVKLVRDDEV